MGTDSDPKPSESNGKIEMNLRFEWLELCEVEVDNNNRVIVPEISKDGAVYRLRFMLPDGGRGVCYIGQTKNLRQRISNYRNADDSAGQATNRKVRDAILNTRAAGGTVRLDAAHAVMCSMSTSDGPLDLDRQSCRLLVESAALVEMAHHETYTPLNEDELRLWLSKPTQ